MNITIQRIGNLFTVIGISFLVLDLLISSILFSNYGFYEGHGSVVFLFKLFGGMFNFGTLMVLFLVIVYFIMRKAPDGLYIIPVIFGILSIIESYAVFLDISALFSIGVL